MFAFITINFGPRTVSLPHRDWANLSWGWCSISLLGDFNPEKGGHLVLWDLRLVIQFPPASSITIPFAMVWHSNIPISSGEMWYSITQYSASALLCWVDNGFIKDSDWLKKASQEDGERWEHAWSTQLKDGLKMLSRLSEL